MEIASQDLLMQEALKHVAVLGAGGKMGRGIALLLLQEIALHKLEKKDFNEAIVFIDIENKTLLSLKRYLRMHLKRFAEKQINLLRDFYKENPSLISNEEVIEYFVENTMDLAQFTTDLMAARSSSLIFEAIIEDVSTKELVFRTLRSFCEKVPLIFTNTSSIPIGYLNCQCQLSNHLIGFHFYNPPSIQKLLEMVIPSEIDSKMTQLAMDIAKFLKKDVIQANDIAGFIGNGYLMREICFACQVVKELAITKPLKIAQAIYLVNRVSEELLIRPMGIFQTMDYVGIDISFQVMNIMRAYIPDALIQDELVEEFFQKGILGGQTEEGVQKPGIFNYRNHKIIGVYSFEEERYLALEEFQEEIDQMGFPKKTLSWHELKQDKKRRDKMKEFFNTLNESSIAEKIALRFIKNLEGIKFYLVDTKVAHSLQDVEKVLQEGFHHL